MTSSQKTLLVTGLAFGAAYGIAARLGMSSLTTVSFLFLVPAALGAVPLLMADPDQIRSFRNIMFIPWVAILSMFALMAALRVERLGCFLLFLIPFIVAAVLAMLITFLVCVVRGSRIKSQKRKAAAAVIALLPFVIAPLEEHYSTSERTVEVGSSVLIAASAERIWPQLGNVETIRDSEYEAGFFNTVMGIPRPIRASVDREGVGARRRGEFSDGLVFDERVGVYERPSRLAFDIAVDAGQLVPGSVERHALSEGYFRFVDATYELEPAGPQHTRLKLSSRYVLRTSVNWYGELWASAIIGDFQDRVLAVLQKRCSDTNSPASDAVAAR
ncbi:MAG TPA: hypothetical protein VM686_10410 [Polyangiaceae bacterium]|nr:hypothetical protein [Polyangiaceae bacterium]